MPVQAAVAGIGHRVGPVVDIQQDRIELTIGTRDNPDNIARFEIDALVLQGVAVECPEKLTVPFDHRTHQFADNHPGVRAKHIECLTQRIAHPQAADEYAGRPAIRQVPAAEPRQFQFRFILTAVHKILAVDRYKKVTVMLIQRQFASIRGPGRGDFYSCLHGST